MEERDAVIVGARCAGATLATALAGRGWDVALVDRDTFPSDTVSTHLLYPNTVARLDELGILDTLRASHRVPFLDFVMDAEGHVFGGRFTPVEGFDRCIAPRRVALDKAAVDTALAAGAHGRFGEKAVELIGSGADDDPVRGVVLESGERIGARWVFGADGRASTVASRLGIEKERRLQGGVAYLMGYWRGLPDHDLALTEIRRDEIIGRWQGEDGIHLITAWGDPDFTKGSARERRRRYHEALARFPKVVDPRHLEAGELIGDLVVAPESLMRGYFRRPTGPGWALVGDACHFKHPATAQGIADAVEQAVFIAGALSDGDAGLAGYEGWRERRSAQHYPWSYAWGRFPDDNSLAMLRGVAADSAAARDLLDTFTRRLEPAEFLTKERLGRWSGGAPPPAA
jgi:2-polyprenyl-6-methoxyphenol hydroxylase-like FAD-dependent oxidoreductase